MNTKDLMIGDWVNLNFDIDYKTGESIYASVQITGINKDGTVDVNFTYDKSESMQDGWDLKLIKPIPLTPEILERNNFQSKEDQYNHRKIFFLGKNEYNLDVYFDNGTIILVEENYEPGIYVYACDCEYVHELQHKLKDLEIEKEIEL